MRKSIYKMVPLIVLFVLLLCGCGESENSGGSTLHSPITVQSWSKMTIHQHMRGLEKPLSRPGYTLIIQEAWKGLHSMKISAAVRIPLI